MKTLLLIIAMVMTLTSHLLSQENNKLDLLKSGGSGGSVDPVKKPIPHYCPQVTEEINFYSKKDTLGELTHNGMGNSKGSFINNGYKNINTIELSYGWISNSTTPIVKNDTSGVSLVLSEDQSNVYFGCLLEIGEKFKGFNISFKNNSQVDFDIIEINNSGQKGPPNKYVLPKGDITDFLQDFHIQSDSSHILIKFLKKDNGIFVLRNLKVRED